MSELITLTQLSKCINMLNSSPNQDKSNQNNSSQNKEIDSAIRNLLSMHDDVLTTSSKLHLRHLRVSPVSVFDDFRNEYHCANRVSPSETHNAGVHKTTSALCEFTQGRSETHNTGVHNKVNNLNSSKRDRDSLKLSKPRQIRAIGVNMGLNKLPACGRYLISRADGVSIVQNVNQSISVNGLRSCHCKHCAVCQTKVAIHRNEYLNRVFQNAIDKNYSLLFVTYTFSHSLRDKASDTKRNLKKMLSGLHNSRRIKRLFKREKLPASCQTGHQTKLFNRNGARLTLPDTQVDYSGYVVRYEDRFSEKSGFHSHAHVIYFIKSDDIQIPPEQKQKIDNTLFTEYKIQAAKHNIKVHKRGFDSRFVDAYSNHLSGYFTKTDIDNNLSNEFTDVFNKSGKNSKSLFQLMEYWHTIKATNIKKANYIKSKVIELSKAISGKRDLVISPQVRCEFLTEHEIQKIDMTDKEIVNQKQIERKLIARFNAIEWSKIRRKNLINYLPVIALRGGIDGILLFLCECGLESTYNPDTLMIEFIE